MGETPAHTGFRGWFLQASTRNGPSWTMPEPCQVSAITTGTVEGKGNLITVHFIAIVGLSPTL